MAEKFGLARTSFEPGNLHTMKPMAPCILRPTNLPSEPPAGFQQKKYKKFNYIMMKSSNGNIFRVTGLLCGEFPTQRPVTRSFDVFLDLRLNKRLRRHRAHYLVTVILWHTLWDGASLNAGQFLKIGMI